MRGAFGEVRVIRHDNTVQCYGHRYKLPAGIPEQPGDSVALGYTTDAKRIPVRHADARFGSRSDVIGYAEMVSK